MTGVVDALAPAPAPARPAPAAAARRAARSGLRAYGMLTSPLRPAPDFLIIGTKRGGTTSMMRYLLAHPDVTRLFPSNVAPKGVRYLDRNYARGDRWYRSHFATVLRRGGRSSPRRLAGEATVDYLFHPFAAERASRACPDARIIVLLRDPVARAWSHWRERTRRGTETLSFEDALAAELDRLGPEDERLRADPHYVADVRENCSYRAQGVYADLLPAWLERYPSERVLVVLSEDLYRDPAAVYGRVLAFLDLRAFRPPAFDAHNFHPARGAMDEETREELTAYYRPHNRRLASMLGLALPWAGAAE